jgi:hypothetical protein
VFTALAKPPAGIPFTLSAFSTLLTAGEPEISFKVLIDLSSSLIVTLRPAVFTEATVPVRAWITYWAEAGLQAKKGQTTNAATSESLTFINGCRHAGTLLNALDEAAAPLLPL